MQCGNCGHELTTGASFCGNCGAQIIQPPLPPAFGVPPPRPQQDPQQQQPQQYPQNPSSPINQPPLPPHIQPPQAPQQPASSLGSQTQYPGVQPVQLHPSSKYNEMSIIALVVLFFFPPASLILGIISLNQIKRSHERGRGLALASIIIGGIVVGFFIIMLGILAAVPESIDS